jgi:hypothetical protein
MTGSTTKYIGAWFAIDAIILLILTPLNVPTFLALVQHGKRTSAEIIRTNCGQHDSGSYAFTVNSTHYENTGLMPGNCANLKKGDVIDVYYDERDPSLSRAREPAASLANELITIGLGCLFVPPLIFLGLMLARARRHKVSSLGQPRI